MSVIRRLLCPADNYWGSFSGFSEGSPHDQIAAMQRLGRHHLAAFLRTFHRPTIQPTKCDVLCDQRVLRQFPRSCKLLKT